MRGVAELFQRLRSYVSCLPELEPGALEALGGDAWLDNATDVTNLILERLGHDVSAADPRFDRTRRGLAKLAPAESEPEPQPEKRGPGRPRKTEGP